MRSICLKTLTLIIAIVQHSYAQPVKPTGAIKTNNLLKTHLDSLVHRSAERYMSSPATFDLSVGLVKDGQQHQYDYHRGDGALSNSRTIFGLGSIAKTFAGMMLAQAVVEKKVRLTDDIRSYLPGKYPNLQYQGHPVRLMDLANHTSALPTMSREYGEKYIDSISKLSPKAFRKFYSVYTADSLLKDMHRFKLDTVPGTKYRYNGNAVMVLITILQRVYHVPYDQLVTKFLRTHLGMYDTKPQLTAADEKRLLKGHNEDGKVLPFIPDYGFRAAPSMFSTPADMLRYAAANLNEKEAAIRLSHQVTFKRSADMSLGLNWMLGKEDNGTAYIMHTGRDGFGFTSLCYLYPKEKIAIVILVNDSNGEGKLSGMKDQIISDLITR